MDLDFNKFKAPTWAMIFLVIFSILCPGILFIYTFNYPLFNAIDTTKLMLLGTSIILPVWAINYFIVLIETRHKTWNNYFETVAIVASITSVPIAYAPIAINHYSKLSFHVAIDRLILIESGLFVMFIFD